MSKGITQDCAMLWRYIVKRGGWWGAARLTTEWAPTFSRSEVERHLVTLHAGGFLEVMRQRDGMHNSFAAYGFTPQCARLPGEPETPEPRRPEVMGSHYVPPASTYRNGSLDFVKLPSVLMGQPQPYRSTLA
ncbi:hypothetical protein [Comamonas sp. SCN 67-35]|uniref:hypothetical protein n=1 Tax=Comamonas sp. SCN 67-35 TaxID=1660096 RepID=UPI0025BD2159|nr:hypothetical protein [Comamonas sp. SCN 67-35]